MVQERGLSFEEHNPSHPKGKNYLLAIGIDEYKNFNKLGNAVLDARTISDLIINNFQFEEQYSKLLLNEEATRENILDTLEDFENKLTKEDNFLLYFAGHGTMNEKKTQGFWVPVDAKNRNSHFVANSRILDIIKDFNAHHIYLLIDSCFSGSLITRKADEDHSDLLEALPSRRVLTSGRKEVVSDGRKGKHSPFAGCIISYLKSKKGEIITSQDLEYHVQKNVQRNAFQHPEAAFLHGLGDQSGQFVFKAKNYEPKEKDSRVEVNITQSSKKGEAEANSIGTFEAWEAYLKEFPIGALIDLAKTSMDRLEKRPNLIQKSHNSKGPIEMVFVEGGTFMMGSEKGDENEKPVHEVSIDTFEIGKYPITQGIWRTILGEDLGIMRNHPNYFKGKNFPVERANWDNVQTFIKRINTKYPNMNYRLPTEAEWEFAAKGGIKSKGYKYSGSNDLGEVGWYWRNSSDQILLIGQKKANELGIYDMSGNVFELCSDWYAPYEAPSNSSPQGPSVDSYRIMRGGSSSFNAHFCRVSHRQPYIPDSTKFNVGFRLARNL